MLWASFLGSTGPIILTSRFALTFRLPAWSSTPQRGAAMWRSWNTPDAVNSFHAPTGRDEIQLEATVRYDSAASLITRLS
jgi:hypothetical protein